MTVNSIDSTAEFVTNGVTTNYPFYFKFLANEDLVVTYVDPLGVSSTLTLGTQYSVNGAGNDQGGSIVTTSALAGPGQLVVSREMEAFQQTSLRNQGKFLAETHEDVFDKLTMLIQQGLAIFRRALTRPFGRDFFYAENRRITNVKDPVEAQDAATKNWVGFFVDSISGVINTAQGIAYDAGTLFDYLRFGVSRQVDTIAALRLLSGSRNQRASVLGYYAAGDMFVRHYRLDPTDVTSTDNGGKVIVGVDGLRWKMIYAGIADPRIFGAKMDGVTDDASAIIATHTAFGEVVLPVGSFAIKSNMAIAGTAMKIHGAGHNKTSLICSVAAGTVLYHTPTSGDHTFDLQDFTMKSALPPVAGQWAIWIDGRSQITTTPYNGKFLTGEREKHRGDFSNVRFETSGDPAVNGFYNGLRVTALLNFSLGKSTFTGKANTKLGEAYAIDGDGVPVDIRFDDMYAYNCMYGLNMPDYVEAVYIGETEFVNVVTGILCGKYQDGRSALANQTLCGSSGMRVKPMHINAQILGMDFRNASFPSIKGTLTVLNPPPGTVDTIGININGSNLGDVIDNTLHVPVPANSTNIYAVVGNGVTNMKMNGNRGQNCYFGVYLVNSSLSNSLTDNRAYLSGLAYGVGADASCNHNYIGRNFGDHSSGLTYSIASLENSVDTQDYSSSVVVAVTAVNNLDVAVAVPSGVFSQVPQAAIAIARNGAKIIGSFNFGGSTTTSLLFNFRSSDGTTMVAGSYAVSIIASLR